MRNNFIYIGGNTYVPYEHIAMLTDYDEPTAKKLVKKAKEEELLYDFSRGQGKETVVLTVQGFVMVTNTELWQTIENNREGDA